MAKKPSWFSQVRDTWRITAPLDPSIRWMVPLTFLAVTALLAVLGLQVGGFALTLTVTSWAWGLLAALYLFGRKAEKAAYGSIEGKTGAAGQVLTTLGKTFFTTQFVEVNRAEEVVHRVVGRCGVVLVIEARPGAAIAQSAKQKTARWVGETPIREVFVGNGQGQVALGSLTRTIKKYPKVLRPAEVTELRRKLDAAAGGSLPIPKGPMPKGLRVPRR